MNIFSKAGGARGATPGSLYRTIWRWHFYAGLFVLPFILILSVTGAIYLFKPQIERREERAYQNLPTINTVTPDRQLAAALAGYPGARFVHYRLPQYPGDAALIHLALPDGTMRDVFVSPAGQRLGSMDPDWRIAEIVSDIHGQLLLGHRGSWLVELAASWAIVMILTGLYLWWPRGGGRSRRFGGVIWPRLRSTRRLFWRDLHAVTGFWIAALALVLLVSGLPWAGVWGQAFKTVRAQFGWVSAPQDWTIGGQHMEHDHGAMAMMSPPAHLAKVDLTMIVAKAERLDLAFPVLVAPPGEMPVWTVKSDAANRPLRVTLTYDANGGQQLTRQNFSDRHPIDRVVGYGIAWHEGQLFGWLNQAIGVATALGLVMLTVSAFILWRRRKPEGRLGAPARAHSPARLKAVAMIIVGLALFLPMLALSLIAVAVFDRLILSRLPRLSRWLGMSFQR